MSGTNAISAVTGALQDLLAKKVAQSGAQVSAQPPNKLTGGDVQNRLNLYLYQIAENAAFMNQPLRDRTRPGEDARPPLALNLRYMITAYGSDDASGDIKAHDLLGQAAALLHNKTITSAEIIAAAHLSGPSGLESQSERVKLTHLNLAHEEMSKLWTMFQAPHRPSAAYEASVVLIDNPRPPRAVMPVLQVGENGRGVSVRVGRGPRLSSIEYRQSITEPGFEDAAIDEVITVRGVDLPLQSAWLVIRDPRPRLGNPEGGMILAELPIGGKTLAGSDPDQLIMQLERDSHAWVPGVLTLEVRQQVTDSTKISGFREESSEPVALSVCPELLRDANGFPDVRLQSGDRRTLVVPLLYPVSGGRKATLVLNAVVGSAVHVIDQEPSAPNAPNDAPQFDVTNIPGGVYRIRVRVDRIDSRLYKRQRNALVFDDKCEVTLP